MPSLPKFVPSLFSYEPERIKRPFELPQAGASEVHYLLEKLSAPNKEHRGIHDLTLFDQTNPRTFKFFNSDLSEDTLTAAFQVDIAGYHLQKLVVETHEESGLRIKGFIETEQGKRIGDFERHIPAPPEKGQPWIAYGKGFHIQDSTSHGKGIGRRLTQRFLVFLHHRGLNAIEFLADKAGAYVFPRLGFDFATPIIRETMKVRFMEYLRKEGIKLSPKEEWNWLILQHAWELASFRLNDGRDVGREFLLQHGREDTDQFFKVRFWLQPDYPGWGHLFAKWALEDNTGFYPHQWDQLHNDTRTALIHYFTEVELMPEILVSAKHHIVSLYDRLHHWFSPLDDYTGLKRFGDEGLAFLPHDIRKMKAMETYSADLLGMMTTEHQNGTELGRLFWKEMWPGIRKHLPGDLLL